jgi:L-threonylcarbamoyladenylate synthase
MASKPSTSMRQNIEKGIAILKGGGVIAYPTDTVYGLGAGIGFPAAIERIYEIKERPRNMPLPLLLADISQLNDVAESIPAYALSLMNVFWPGGLTLVVPACAALPDIVTAGGNTVAVRIPAHPVPLTLVRGLGSPIVGTSANLSGRGSPVTAGEACSQLGDRIDLLIDGGRCPGGVESTIVDVTSQRPTILREGAITSAQIERACGVNLFSKGVA